MRFMDSKNLVTNSEGHKYSEETRTYMVDAAQHWAQHNTHSYRFPN